MNVHLAIECSNVNLGIVLDMLFQIFLRFACGNDEAKQKKGPFESYGQFN